MSPESPNNFESVPLEKHSKATEAIVPSQLLDEIKQEAPEVAAKHNAERTFMEKALFKNKMDAEDLIESGDYLHSKAVDKTVEASLKENLDAVDAIKKERTAIGNLILDQRRKVAEDNLKSAKRIPGTSNPRMIARHERVEREARSQRVGFLSETQLSELIDTAYLTPEAIRSIGTELSPDAVDLSTIEGIVADNELFATKRGGLHSVQRITSVEDYIKVVRSNGKKNISFISVPKEKVQSLGLEKNFAQAQYAPEEVLNEYTPISLEEFLEREAEVRSPEEVEKIRKALMIEGMMDINPRTGTHYGMDYDPKNTKIAQKYWIEKAKKTEF